MAKYHLLGIGGAGMSVVAELLHLGGHQVSGSDRAESAALKRLRDLGLTCHIGHDAAQVPPGATLVVSSAIRPDNPELVAAQAAGLTVLHRSQALAIAAAQQSFIAVAGAHGKTTTAAMLATILAGCGFDPSFAIGAVLPKYGTGARAGAGNVFVAEADESDGSFLNYDPAHAIITNIEPDHLDHYGTRAAFFAAFETFVGRVAGRVFACFDDGGARDLAARFPDRVTTYGTMTGAVGGSEAQPDIVISGVELDAEGCLCTVTWGEIQTRLQLPIGGRHNLLNACGAWACAVELGADPHQAAAALSGFGGTARRFQPVGRAAGVSVYDDYAHHPTEVAAALAQARQVAGAGRVLVVFQPHLYSRTRNFAQQFATALQGADWAGVCAIYGAREEPIPGVGPELLATSDHVKVIPDMGQAGHAAVAAARSGDIILTMGAGDITTLGPAIVAELAARTISERGRGGGSGDE